MGAKQKLNAFHIGGALFFASLVWASTNDARMFVLFLVILLCTSFMSGEIRK
jgi:hypothetical protein